MSGLEEEMTTNELVFIGLNQTINGLIKWGLSIGKSYKEIAKAIASHINLLQIWNEL
jgi:hypothetical protein